MKKTMNRDEFVKYLRKKQMSVPEFYALLENWFNLTRDERWELLKETAVYKQTIKSKI